MRHRELQRRWVHEARGRDPDDPALLMHDLEHELETTLRMLAEVAAAEDIDLDAPLPPRVVVLDAERLSRASMALVHSLAGRQQSSDERAAAVEGELLAIATTLAAKSARIAGYLGDRRTQDEVWTSDAAPNLLLLDRLKRQFREVRERLSDGTQTDDPISRALTDLDRILDPLVAELGAARAMLAALEACDAAPSPFLRAPAGHHRASIRGR